MSDAPSIEFATTEQLFNEIAKRCSSAILVIDMPVKENIHQDEVFYRISGNRRCCLGMAVALSAIIQSESVQNAKGEW